MLQRLCAGKPEDAGIDSNNMYKAASLLSTDDDFRDFYFYIIYIYILFFTRCDVICDLLQYTHTWKNVIYLFYTIKIQMFYWRIFGAWEKKNKSADVIWRGFDAICVCPLIDHGEQPMKMHTGVTLLYNSKYIIHNIQ